jgi:hypothetical protein
VNIIQKEILKSILSIKEKTASEFDVNIVFSEDFTGFNGHFDERPVLPAICLLEIIKCSLYKQFNIMPVILEIISAKFYNVISAKEIINIIIKTKENVLDDTNLTEDYLIDVKFSGAAGKKSNIKVKIKFDMNHAEK